MAFLLSFYEPYTRRSPPSMPRARLEMVSTVPEYGCARRFVSLADTSIRVGRGKCVLALGEVRLRGGLRLRAGRGDGGSARSTAARRDVTLGDLIDREARSCPYRV